MSEEFPVIQLQHGTRFTLGTFYRATWKDCEYLLNLEPCKPLVRYLNAHRNSVNQSICEDMRVPFGDPIAEDRRVPATWGYETWLLVKDLINILQDHRIDYDKCPVPVKAAIWSVQCFNCVHMGYQNLRAVPKPGLK